MTDQNGGQMRGIPHRITKLSSTVRQSSQSRLERWSLIVITASLYRYRNRKYVLHRTAHRNLRHGQENNRSNHYQAFSLDRSKGCEIHENAFWEMQTYLGHVHRDHLCDLSIDEIREMYQQAWRRVIDRTAETDEFHRRIEADATGLDPGAVDEYDHRWEIESGYRSIKRFMAATTSKNFVLRSFYFAFACLLYSIWRAVDLLVQVELTGEYEQSPIVTADNTLTLLNKETGIG